MVAAFDKAWQVLKAPVVDTPLDNLQMVHHEYAPDFPNKVGSQPPNWPMHRDSTMGVTTVEQMTPNEYFDHIRDGMVNTNEFADPTGDAGDEWRWNQHEDSKEYINQLADRLRSGEQMQMGMPSLQMQDEENHWQEGGHRMEALRQIGRGDTKFPVLVARR